MTSLDQYQIVNIIFLVLCCIWHSIVNSLYVTADQKGHIDTIIVGVFGGLFTLIQVIFVIMLCIGARKVLLLRRRDAQYKAITCMSSTSEDENGWYATAKGDNSPKADAEKIRFYQVSGIVAAIIY